MSNGDPRGQFVWHELLTGDAGAATAFYTKVVPWKTQAWEQDPGYSMWVAKNGPVGGIASLGDSAAPKWLAYIGVSDVDATIESAKSLGARVLKGATEISNGGVYALLADPQGAEFGIYKSSQPSNGAAGVDVGDFSWHELATSDAKAALEFYTKLFGWEPGPVHDMGGPVGNYYLFLRDGNQYGGIYNNTDAGGPNWLSYINVEDAGKAANAVKTAGGRVINGPMEVPGGDWVAMALDAEGVAFAVHEPAKAKPVEAAKPKSSITKPPKAAKSGGAASSITKPPEAEASGGGAASSITKPPQATGGGAASSITKPPKVAASGGGAASSITKPPQATGGGAASSITKPPKAAAKKAKKKAAPAKKAAARKGAAKKAGKKAAKGKAVARKAAGKKKSAAKRAPAKKASARKAPAKKKATRAKAKKRR